MILNLAIDLVRSDLIHKGLPSTLPGTAPKGGGDVEATIRYLDDFAGQFEFQTVVEDDFFPFATTACLRDRLITGFWAEPVRLAEFSGASWPAS